MEAETTGSLRRVARYAGASVAALGILVLIGWALGIGALKTIAPTLASMKANTALAFVLAGAALVSISAGHRALALSLASAALGAVTLLQDLLGLDLGIDELLVSDRASPHDAGAPGRMSPATAFNFVLAGVALAALGAARREALAQWLALLVLASALVAVVGYAYDVRALYEVWPYTSTALHTAVGFGVLAVGLLFARGERGWMRGVLSAGPGGTMLRRVFVPAVLGLLLIGWLRVTGQDLGYYDTHFGTALLVIATGLMFGSLAWRCARLLDESAKVTLLLANAPPAIVWMADVRGRVSSINERWTQLTGTPSASALGRGWLEFVHPEDRSYTTRELEDALEARSSFVIQHRFRVADGSYRTMVLAGSPWFEAGDEFRGYFGSSLDVTPLERAKKALTHLARRLLETEESERRALSRELHDRVGQNLSALSLNLQLIRKQLSDETGLRVADRIDEAQELLEQTTSEVRDVMIELRPPGLDDYGLATALRNYVDRIAQRYPARLVILSGDDWPRLAIEIELALFRIAQEALTNAARHAQAGNVEIRLEVDAEGQRMTIDDDGVGFEPDQVSGARWGLATMRERADAVGLRLRIDSVRRHGTRITAEMPRRATGETGQ